MNRTSLIVVFFISFFLMGCPEETNNTLVDEPNLNIDKRLLGDWEVKNQSDYFAQKITISKASSKEYKLTVTEKTDEYSVSTTTFRAYLTIFNDIKFLTVNDENNGTNYFFILSDISKKELEIFEFKFPSDMQGLSNDVFRNNLYNEIKYQDISRIYTSRNYWVKNKS
jgi:hypothetical protein